MIVSSPRHLSLLLLFLIPLIIFFRGDLSRRFQSTQVTKTVSEWSQSVLHRSNASSFEHDGVFDDTAEGAPRLAQVSMQYGDKFDLMYERGLRTHIENGEKWGYPTHYLRFDIVGKGEVAEGVYDKLLYLLTIMVNEMTKPFGKRAEWIVWFDADTVLLNNNVPWTIFLPPNIGMFRDINMLITKDWQGFNAGIFLIRVCEWSIHMLSDAIALPRLRPDVQLGFREQDAVKWVFGRPENKKHRLYQPRHWFNVYDTYYEQMGEVIMNGTLVVHFPGMGQARPDGMGKWLDILDHNPGELQVPLQNTSYPTEIESYWSRLKSAATMLQRSDDWLETIKADEGLYDSIDEHIPTRISDAKRRLQEIVQEDPFDKDRLREAVLKLGSAVKMGRKITDAVQLKQEEEQKADAENERQSVEDQAREAEEEQMKKEEARRKAEETKKKAKEEKKKANQEEKKAKQEEDSATEEMKPDTDAPSDSDGDQNFKTNTASSHQSADYNSELKIKQAEDPSQSIDDETEEREAEENKEEEDEIQR